MEYLPLEIEENILSYTSPEKLLALCQTNRDYYSLCSNYNFWLRKFREENIYPYLIEDIGPGGTPTQYVQAYKNTLQAMNQIRQFSNIPSFSVKISSLLPLSTLLIPGVDTKAVTKIYEQAIEYDNFAQNVIKNVYEEAEFFNSLYLDDIINALEAQINNTLDRFALFVSVTKTGKENPFANYSIIYGHKKYYSVDISFNSLEIFLFRSAANNKPLNFIVQ